MAGYTEIWMKIISIPSTMVFSIQHLRYSIPQVEAPCGHCRGQSPAASHNLRWVGDKAMLRPNGREPSTSHCGDKLNCTKGDIEKHGIIFTEAKGLDNQWPKSSNTSTWNTEVWSASLVQHAHFVSVNSRNREH